MERNTTDEMIEICQAIKDGKKIEWYGEHSEKWLGLLDDEKPDFDDYTYRIKPEEPKKWRPFRDTKELFEVNGSSVVWLKNKSTNEACVLVTAYYPYEVGVCGYKWTMEELLNIYTFADGTPCGVEEDV